MRDRSLMDPERLRDLLRRGDPACDLDPEEAARLRGLILREASRRDAREASRRLPRWGLAWAAAASLALAVAVGWNRQEPELAAPEAAQPWLVHTGVAPSEPVRRQVQFTTPGGTRIIWILNPGSPEDRSTS